MRASGRLERPAQVAVGGVGVGGLQARVRWRRPRSPCTPCCDREVDALGLGAVPGRDHRDLRLVALPAVSRASGTLFTSASIA